MEKLPSKVRDCIGRNLYQQKQHPLCLIKDFIYSYPKFAHFTKFDDLEPVVDVYNNFDALLIPADHPSRSKSDTYYVDDTHVMRTQTSAHQNQLLKAGHKQFLVTGDVYRKDEVDRTHYPVFHQMEGVCVLDDEDDEDGDEVDGSNNKIYCSSSSSSSSGSNKTENALKATLAGLVEYLFPGCQYRFNNDYFPFTNPSFEVEVEFTISGKKRWLEVLGCGVVQPQIMSNCGLHNKKAWAFGLGLERLAMIAFNIQDIRLFWIRNDKFDKQFAAVNNSNILTTKFKPFSVLPNLSRDVSFWLPMDGSYVENDFYEQARDYLNDVVESICLIDKFTHPKTQRQSVTYRFVLSSYDDNLTDPAQFTQLANQLMSDFRQELLSRGYAMR